ncbi:MAG: hypothetical protein WB767_05245 [Nocardioides sp.]
MSNQTSSARPAVLGALSGALLLAVVVGFAVGVPELKDGETGEASGSLEAVELPDVLPGGLIANDSGRLPTDLVPADITEQIVQVQESAAAQLGDLYDAPAALRGYSSLDGTTGGYLIVLDQAPGLFAPEGPPIDAEVNGFARAPYELIAVDGAICDISWGSPVELGQPVDEEQVPGSVRCQLGDGGRTWEINVSGLTADAAVEILHSLADA